MRAGRTRAIFARVINGVARAPHPLTVVVFGGSYSGRGCMRGDTVTGAPAPIKALRRAIARQRIEVVVDEFRSTIMITHNTCGTDLIPRPHDPTRTDREEHFFGGTQLKMLYVHSCTCLATLGRRS